MKNKHKLSFWILLISTCLVQSTSVAERRNEELTSIASMGNGGAVPNGSALITNVLPSNNIKIEDGGVEVVDNGGYSIDATIEKGGMQIVTRGGTAIQTKIEGGQQFVHEEAGLNLISLEKKSGAYDATVTGGDGSIGQQNIYDGAWAWETKVKSGGEQNLYAANKHKGGVSMNAKISGNGRQHVLALGESYDTTLSENATQVVYPSGFVDSLTIMDSARSWFHSGLQKVVGEVRVNGSGKLYLFAGDRTNHTTKKTIPIQGRSSETIFKVGERTIGEKPQMEIEDLGGNNGTVIFTSIPYDPRHISLRVERLSGSLHFQFNIDTMGGSDYLSIEESTGNHKISVADTGREITGPLSQRNSLRTEIPLITERSGDANFTLVNSSGISTQAVDGGAYMYGLYKRERCADSSGGFTIWYLGMSTENTESSSTGGQCAKQKPKVTTFSSSLSTDTGKGSHRGSSSRGKKPSNKQPPKSRPPRHLKDAQSASGLAVSSSSENPSRVALPPVGHSHLASEQQQATVSADASLTTDQRVLRPSDDGQASAQKREEISKPRFLTSPSTDAVLSMSVAPAVIFHNELQTIRAGRGDLDRSQKNAGFWTYAIKSKENIAAKHIDFKLEQTGIVLGLNGLSEWENGDIYIGGFGSYDRARVEHARGGVSGINTYGVGAYVTYSDHSGWYIDGLFKYNRYQNSLKAVSTNGIAIEGNYDQWAVGTSFETGYRVRTSPSSWLQPYGQLTWLQVKGQEIKLSNDMMGDIKPFTSLRSEVGLSLGYEFGTTTAGSSLAYITAVWLREYKDDNHTTINQRHQFTTDLSGNAGKLGIGLSSLLSDHLKLYAEAHYVKGRKTNQSLQGILGVRYSF
ncbi:BafA family autotransporter [Bartonella sp. ML70XJBT.G]|uniref:BafA family autotransporter n=1 Tax=Bartonella sp. ML70XJBT.G TaxID=3019093 RepID=UPI002361BB3D|nr:BafA family autotransporter [Bartonella sp. ML70XJBT.G]